LKPETLEKPSFAEIYRIWNLWSIEITFLDCIEKIIGLENV